jgi:hypothetical protein
MDKDRDQDQDRDAAGALDALDARLNPYGRHLRHLAEHAGTIPGRLDEFGRCVTCVRLGWWRPDA